ncbi:MAG TPA: hypothetical protein VF532_17590 [Candidatus Angelobacter sp.]
MARKLAQAAFSAARLVLPLALVGTGRFEAREQARGRPSQGFSSSASAARLR